MIILRCTNDEGIVQDIQVQDQIPLKLDISAIENTSIGDVYGISSQEFSVPGDGTVNQFFGNLFNLGATPSVALQNSINCQVLLSGAEVFKGKLYIKNIITDQQGFTAYNVVVVNETVDFKFENQTKYLAQYDFSQYNHNLTYANVSASWGGGLLNGSIVYPFVNYGKPEGSADAPNFAFAAFNSTGSNTIDNYDSPLRLIDFKPAIKVKDVVDVIFSGSSYDYTSSFFNSAYFNNLYVLPTANDQLGPNNISPVSQSAWAYNASGSQYIPKGNIALVEFDAEIVDNANNFDLATERYTADTTGNYQYQINVTYYTQAWAPSNANTVTIQLRKNGGSIINSQLYYSIPETGSAFLQGAVSLNAGDYLEVEIAPAGKDIEIANEIGQPSYYPNGNVTYFQVKGPASLIGGNVNMAAQFPDDLKALDFLQGLIEKFNLVVEPVPNSRNLIRIEPFQTWWDSGVVKDWTQKVDRQVRFEISHPILEQPRTLIFSDETDEDVLNQYTLDTKGTTYGSYTYTSDSDLAEGERRIGKVFAATPVTGVPNGRTFVVPHLCTITDNNQFRPMKFKPRLLYNNGLQTVPQEALGIQTGSIDRGTVYVRDENSNVQPTKIWNQMSTLTAIPVNYESGQDLHFNNDLYTPYFQASANGKVKADAFRTYWATYVNSLYDIDSRKLVCNIYLKPTDIQNIGLNDKIFIDGAYYRINKINGANLSFRDSVEVELIKQLANQLKFPRRVVDGTSLTLDYGSLSIDGTGRYINTETGEFVDDYQKILSAGIKDGFKVYNSLGTGSVVWDYQQPVDNTNQFDQRVLGTNQVAVGASKVSATGNNNEVKTGVETALVVGSNNFIGENTSNVTTLGQNHSVESLSANAQIIGGEGNTISGSLNSVIVGGTGSLFVNNDWAVSINGENDAIRDSDFTTAINSHANEVIINGSGHTVIGLNLEGGGLDLLNTRDNTNWLGDTYLGEAQFIVPYTLNIGDGSNIFLTGSNQGQGRHESLYILNWNGLSPGTASINLPSYTNSDYTNVVYTFKANGTFNGTTYLRILPFAGQNIEASSSYAFSNAYDYVQLFARSGSWLVLNAPGGGIPVSSSYALSASFAATASFTPNAIVTASVSYDTITFTKGNGTTFPIAVSNNSLMDIAVNQIAGFTTSSGYVSYTNVNAQATYNVHISESGVHWVDFTNLSTAVSSSVNLYYWPELLPTSSVAQVVYTAPTGAAAPFVRYSCVATASANYQYWASGVSLGVTAVQVNRTSRPQRFWGNATNQPMTMAKGSNGVVYLAGTAGGTPAVIGTQNFLYTGTNGVAIP